MIEFLNIASFLDPRFKTLAHLKQQDKTSVTNAVIHHLVTLLDNGSSTADDDIVYCGEISHCSHASEEPVPKKTALNSLFGEMFSPQQSNSAPNVKSLIKKEIVFYKEEGPFDMCVSPIVWWKDQQLKYPLLSKAAKNTLVVQATSVSAERVFSVAGDVVSAKRAALDPDTVNSIIFINKNYKLIDIDDVM